MQPPYYELAHKAFEAQRFSDALELLRAARAEGQGSEAGILEEASCLYYLCRAPEAIALVEEVARKNSTNRLAYNAILALYYRAIGEFDVSARLLSEVPVDTPGYAFLQGWHLLRQGKFLEGMRIREKEPGIYRADVLYKLPPEKKYQRGSTLAGLTIALVLEGGNGDEIAYARFAQVLHARGARVVACASRGLLSIISRMPGIAKAITPEELRPDMYDQYIPALSMISLFDVGNPSEGVTFPYATSSLAGTTLFKALTDTVAVGRKKIGIQWRGNAQFDYSEFKTFPIEILVPFAHLGQLFSLQVDDTRGVEFLSSTAGAYDLQQMGVSWERTLSAISEMDCVVSGDTTIAHIAGALGIPTALLLPHAPHAYWADLHEQSTWYPSVRVFRQPHYNDWGGAARDAYEWIQRDF